MEDRTHEIRFPFLFILTLKFPGIVPNPLHRWFLKVVDHLNVKDSMRL